MPPRLKAVELAVGHVRKPGERMPIAALPAGESPADPLGRQPANDLPILVDILIVVVVDETVAQRPAKNEKHGQHEKPADGQ